MAVLFLTFYRLDALTFKNIFQMDSLMNNESGTITIFLVEFKKFLIPTF